MGKRKPLRSRIVTALLASALLSLALSAFRSWIVPGKLLEQRALDQMQAPVTQAVAQGAPVVFIAVDLPVATTFPIIL